MGKGSMNRRDLHVRAVWSAYAVQPARRVEGRLRLTGSGHGLRLALIFLLLLSFPLLFGDHGWMGTVYAAAILWNPTARSAYGLLGWFPVNLYRGLTGDDVAGWTGAISAAALGGTVMGAAATTYNFTTGSVPTIPVNLAVKLKIDLNGCTIKLSSTVPRAFDINRTADYQTFQNVEICNGTVDRNNVAPASNNHVVIGNLINGAWSQRLNFRYIAVYGVKTINVPTGTTVSHQNISLVSAHLASNEATQTSIKDIRIEDCDFQGGNVGVAMMGSVTGGGSVTAGQGVNVFIDRISTNFKHDTLRTPTAFSVDANLQIGGYGFCGMVRARDVYGANSADVGIEIDNCQDFLGVGCEVVDAFNAKLFCTNFRDPISLETQKNTWRDCWPRSVNYQRTASHSGVDFLVQGAGDYAGGFGEYVVENGHSEDLTAWGTPNAVGLAVNAYNVKFRKLKVNLSVAMTGLAITAGGGSPSMLAIRSNTTGAESDIDVHFVLKGTRSGAGNNQWRMVAIDGSNTCLKSCRVSADLAGLTGLSTGSDTFYWVALGSLVTTTGLKAQVDKVRCTTAPSSGTHHAVYFDTSLTVTGNVPIRGLDTSLFTAGAGFDISNVPTAMKQAGQVQIMGSVSTRTSASGSGPLDGRTTITPGASPFNYQNLDNMTETVTVTGGTVSLIEYSADGTNYVTLGQTSGLFILRPGYYLRVTYSVAPTMWKYPG